jgi:predicted GH43/DUF377 family glycosyl hydrolase
MHAASLCALSLVILSGCNRYADFSLRAPPPAQAGAASFDWKPDASPVLSPGEWDSVDVLNPSVVHGAAYYNFYSGFDGKSWRTGLATSSDGVQWRKHGSILSPRPDTWEGSYIAANGSALLDRDEFLYWYVAGPREAPRIGLAHSPDGEQWTRRPTTPVLGTGPRGSWDERGVADPDVLRVGDWLYMYYLGQDRASRQRLGVARSHDGVHWQKLRVNPVLEMGEDGAFDENGLGEPAVWQSHGKYWMLYTGRDRKEYRRLGLARSTDGVTWEKLPGSFAGSERWNEKVICDPSVLIEGDSIRVWFGGGDAASPDENLHGHIGVARLIPKS